MTSYSLVRYTPREGTFVDTADEQVAIQEAREAYEQGINAEAFVLHKVISDYESEPTHIVLDDVLYKLVEVN